MQNSLQYKINDIVFARCRNQPFWPAKIIRILEEYRIYQVKFFNHNSNAYIDEFDLLPLSPDSIKKQKKSLLMKIRESKLQNRIRTMIVRGIEMAEQELKPKRQMLKQQNSPLGQKNQVCEQQEIQRKYNSTQKQRTLQQSFEAMINKKRSANPFSVPECSIKKQKLNQEENVHDDEVNEDDAIDVDNKSEDYNEQPFNMEHVEYEMERKFSKLKKRSRQLKKKENQMRKNSLNMIESVPDESIVKEISLFKEAPENQMVVSSYENSWQEELSLDHSFPNNQDPNEQVHEAALIHEQPPKIEQKCEQVLLENESSRLQVDQIQLPVEINLQIVFDIKQENQVEQKQGQSNALNENQERISGNQSKPIDIDIAEVEVEVEKSNPISESINCLRELSEGECVDESLNYQEIQQYMPSSPKDPAQDQELDIESIVDEVVSSPSEKQPPQSQADLAPNQQHSIHEFSQERERSASQEEIQVHQDNTSVNTEKQEGEVSQSKEKVSEKAQDNQEPIQAIPKPATIYPIIELQEQLKEMPPIILEAPQKQLSEAYMPPNQLPEGYEQPEEEQIWESSSKELQYELKMAAQMQINDEILSKSASRHSQNLFDGNEASSLIHHADEVQELEQNSIVQPQKYPQIKNFSLPETQKQPIDVPEEQQCSINQEPNLIDNGQANQHQKDYQSIEVKPQSQKVGEQFGLERQKLLQNDENPSIVVNEEKFEEKVCYEPMEIEYEEEPKQAQHFREQASFKIELFEQDHSNSQENRQANETVFSNPLYDVLQKRIHMKMQVGDLEQMCIDEFDIPPNYINLVAGLHAVQARLKEVPECILLKCLINYIELMNSYLSSKSNPRQRLLSMTQRQLFLAIISSDHLSSIVLYEAGIIEQLINLIKLYEGMPNISRASNYRAQYLMTKARMNYYEYSLSIYGSKIGNNFRMQKIQGQA